MLLHPGIIALLTSSGLITLLVLYAAWYGVRILRQWDLASGSSRQLELERRTYLISSVLTMVFVFQILSLFLYIYTADSLCALFVGAMCAAGTLNVNRYGYPVLMLKTLNFVVAGLWLIVNEVDNQAYDYPLIRKKYAFLMVMTPLILTEAALQTMYFIGLRPDVITSCCGSLFSVSSRSVAAEVAAFPAVPMEIIFFVTMVLIIAAGFFFYRTQKGGSILAFLSGAGFLIATASILSFISLYVYELPTHHCPFCILQKEYGYIGYLLYATLLAGTVSGLGVGILMPFRRLNSLAAVIPSRQKRLAMIALLSYAAFTGIVAYRILVSHLIL